MKRRPALFPSRVGIIKAGVSAPAGRVFTTVGPPLNNIKFDLLAA